MAPCKVRPARLRCAPPPLAVAHNIRNPLAAIRSSAELMSGQAGAGQQDYSGDLMNEVDRLDLLCRHGRRHGIETRRHCKS
jgi:hypothetical protein